MKEICSPTPFRVRNNGRKVRRWGLNGIKFQRGEGSRCTGKRRPFFNFGAILLLI
jgi:hypothetical protein